MDKKENVSRPIKKQIGITMIALSSALLVFTIFRIIPGIQDFFLGVFGIMLYPLLAFILLFGIALSLNLKFVYSPKYIVYLALCFFFFICVLHIIFTGFSAVKLSYGQYLSSCFQRRFTPGGLFIGLFTFPITSLLHDIAGIVIYGIALIISLYFVVSYLETVKAKNPKEKTKYQNFEEMSNSVEFDSLFDREEKLASPPKMQVEQKIEVENDLKNQDDTEIFIKDEQKEEKKDEVSLAKEKLGLNQKREIDENFLKQEKIIEKKEEKPNSEWQNRAFSGSLPHKFMDSEEVKETKPNPALDKNKEYLRTILNTQNDNSNPIINAEDYEDYKQKIAEIKSKEEMHRISRDEPKVVEPDEDVSFGIEPQRVQMEHKNIDNKSIDGLNDGIDDGLKRGIISDYKENENYDDYIKPKAFEGFSPIENDIIINNFEEKEEEISNPQKFNEAVHDSVADSLGNTISLDTTPRTFNFEVINGPVEQKPPEPNFEYGEYVAPPLDLLKTYINEEDTTTNIEENIASLERVLADFGVPAKVEDVRRGAAVTRYELHMPSGITVRKVEAHAQDIALALAAKRDIRIEAPIKGKSAVGIEVPNNKVDIVGLKDILQSPEFVNSRSPLNFALGKDVDGSIRCCNLAKMPHLLVAGSTNSGKSSCLNSLLISLIYHTSPEDLRLLLVDPKQVEFNSYSNIPHLLMPNAITDMKKVLPALDWLIAEMERRYTLFRDNYVRNLDEYNALPDVKKRKKSKLPSIVLIVDELADLVVTLNRKDLDDRIIRLTQKARAAGIHLILATQRPSVDIITGVIKANLPSKIAFAVARVEDSKTILGQGGAENLLGRGDMLYAPNDGGDPTRVQGSWVDTPEIQAVVDFVKANNPSVYDENIAKAINNESSPQGGGSYNPNPAVDALMPDALRHVIETGQASSSMLQRKFAIGFQRASKIIDQMESAGFISSQEGSKPRVVYATMEDYYKIYGGGE